MGIFHQAIEQNCFERRYYLQSTAIVHNELKLGPIQQTDNLCPKPDGLGSEFTIPLDNRIN